MRSKVERIIQHLQSPSPKSIFNFKNLSLKPKGLDKKRRTKPEIYARDWCKELLTRLFKSHNQSQSQLQSNFLQMLVNQQTIIIFLISFSKSNHKSNPYKSSQLSDNLLTRVFKSFFRKSQHSRADLWPQNFTVPIKLRQHFQGKFIKRWIPDGENIRDYAKRIREEESFNTYDMNFYHQQDPFCKVGWSHFNAKAEDENLERLRLSNMMIAPQHLKEKLMTSLIACMFCYSVPSSRMTKESCIRKFTVCAFVTQT